MTDRATLRREALARREREAEREEKGRRIVERLQELEEFAAARTVCTYVGVRSEVPTLPLVVRMIVEGKRVVVPVCHGDGLLLVQVTAVDELVPAGRFGLLEPRPELADEAQRLCPAEAVDLFLVPGVAFDPDGARLGYGRGYYDRLLASARPDAPKIGLAFEGQMVPRIATEPHDVPMDRIITERTIYTPPPPPPA